MNVKILEPQGYTPRSFTLLLNRGASRRFHVFLSKSFTGMNGVLMLYCILLFIFVFDCYFLWIILRSPLSAFFPMIFSEYYDYLNKGTGYPMWIYAVRGLPLMADFLLREVVILLVYDHITWITSDETLHTSIFFFCGFCVCDKIDLFWYRFVILGLRNGYRNSGLTTMYQNLKAHLGM